MLLEDEAPAHVRPDLERIQAAGRTLLSLINEILDPARAEGASAEDMEAASARIRHDLRTPVNAILGYSEMLIEDAQASGQDHSVDDLKRIHGAGQKLLVVIDDIMRLSAGVRTGVTEERDTQVSMMIEQAVSSLHARDEQDRKADRGRPHPRGGRQRDQPRHALAPAGAPGLHAAVTRRERPRGAGAAAGGAVRPRAPGHPDAGDERLPGARAAQARSRPAPSPRDHDLRPGRDRQRGALHRDRGRGLPAQALQPRRSCGRASAPAWRRSACATARCCTSARSRRRRSARTSSCT